MDLLEDFKMSFLNFNFMIYIIHKMLALLKNHLNYLKDSTFECFLMSIIDFYFFCNFFSRHIMMESLSLEEEKIIKDIRNLLRLKKEQNYTAIKDITNLLA